MKNSKNLLAKSMEEIKEDLVTDPEIEIDTSDIDYTQAEITKGFECLSELFYLSDKIDIQKSREISLESYSDFAQMAFDSIKRKIGLETDNTFVENIKDFIKKLLEILKLLGKKVKEYFFSFKASYSNSNKNLDEKLDTLLLEFK